MQMTNLFHVQIARTCMSHMATYISNHCTHLGAHMYAVYLFSASTRIPVLYHSCKGMKYMYDSETPNDALNDAFAYMLCMHMLHEFFVCTFNTHFAHVCMSHILCTVTRVHHADCAH